MKRRLFIQYFSASALGSLFLKQVDHLFSPSGREESRFASPDLLQMLSERDVVDIGRAYRGTHKNENSVRVLGGKLAESTGHGRSPSRKALQRRVAADFEQGSVVKVNGWILSVTEARQCALYSLLHA